MLAYESLIHQPWLFGSVVKFFKIRSTMGLQGFLKNVGSFTKFCILYVLQKSDKAISLISELRCPITKKLA